MGKLENRAAIITGGAGNAGRVICRLFAQEGCAVMVVDLNKTVGQKLVEEIRSKGGRADFFKADVTKEEEIKAAVNACVEKFGKLDTLVNLACIMSLDRGYLVDVKAEEFDTDYAINLRATFLFMKYCIPEMLKAGMGRIVNFSTTAAASGMLGHAGYAACKAGVEALVRTGATQYGKQNIRVNGIRPGTFPHPDALKRPEIKEWADLCLSHTPIPRIGRSADAAPLALFLVSDDSDFINGTIVTMDGGATCHQPQWREDMDPANINMVR